MPVNRKGTRSKNKINLVFDEQKRREFLTGFHKRKLQRIKKGQEKLETELKDERKRLKIKAKESYKNLLLSNYKIPELELMYDEEYNDDDVTIEIKELASNNIQQDNTPKVNTSNDAKCEDGISNNLTQKCDIIPGMELKQQQDQQVLDKQVFTSKKSIKKELMKVATKNLQNSKVFQKKNKVERQKQKKKSLKLKKEKMKQERRLGKKHVYNKRH